MRKLIIILMLLIGSCGCYAQSHFIQREGNGTSGQGGSNSNVGADQDKEPKRDLRGYDAVDLGLPSGLLWATCNVGATRPDEYGDYFGWGEIRTKDEYHSMNSMTWDRQIGEISRDSKYDAARSNLGGSWRIPTMAEMTELLSSCDWTWVSRDGITGYTVTGPNGNQIFLPAAGYRYGTSLLYAGSDGDYWTATPNEQIPIDACRLIFAEAGHEVGWVGRECAFTIRPVSD